MLTFIHQKLRKNLRKFIVFSFLYFKPLPFEYNLTIKRDNLRTRKKRG